MSNLLLPPGVEPPPDPSISEVPEAIADSMMLLVNGIDMGSLCLMRRPMDDGAGDKVYDLCVGIPHPITQAMRFYPIARMLPQHPQEGAANEPGLATVPAPDSIN